MQQIFREDLTLQCWMIRDEPTKYGDQVFHDYLRPLVGGYSSSFQHRSRPGNMARARNGVGGKVDLSQWSKYFTEVLSREHKVVRKPQPNEDACQVDQAKFVQCLNSNTVSVTNCQEMIDALHECRKNESNAQSKSRKTLMYEAPSAETVEHLNAYQTGLLQFFDCVNNNVHDIMSCQELMDALRRSR